MFSILLILSALATIAASVMVLATQRSRAEWAAVTLLSTSSATALIAFIVNRTHEYRSVLDVITTLPLALTIGILLGLALAKEKRQAR